ncbi:hypothetical protein [Leptospira weilii]|uniref:hypothetical protein n=1 Tax=Leptospira weilii TaxID=28184 RepID=UPI00035FB5F6|nr:hypothetical protein [Leptospira weilii]
MNSDAIEVVLLYTLIGTISVWFVCAHLAMYLWILITVIFPTTPLPNWDNSPDWANYRAKDKSGDWFWFEEMPIPDQEIWTHNEGRFKEIELVHQDWEKSLEKRPN